MIRYLIRSPEDFKIRFDIQFGLKKILRFDSRFDSELGESKIRFDIRFDQLKILTLDSMIRANFLNRTNLKIGESHDSTITEDIRKCSDNAILLVNSLFKR